MNISETYRKYISVIREKILNLFHRYSVPRWMVFVFDNLAVFLTFLLAYLLRFNFDITSIPVKESIYDAGIAFVIYSIFSLLFRSYSGLIRHATLTDISLVFAVTTISAFVLLSVSLLSKIFKWNHVLTIPFSVILIHYGLITVFLFFVRVSVKVIFRLVSGSLRSINSTLIYGAGELGFVAKRVIMSDPNNGFSVKGFIDDNKKLHGKKINDIPVFGPEVLSGDFLQKHKIQTLIIAIKNILPGKKGEIIRKSVDLGLEIFETPSIEKWLKGKPEIHHLKKVRLEDLLGREQNKPDLELIWKGLSGKTILVTGAAGSIGAEIVRQLPRYLPGKVILVDQAETPLYEIENELTRKKPNLQFHFLIGDVTNAEKMDTIFRDYKPDIVYHTAAYKHVPLMEENPHEAFRVNIGGTKVIADLSVKYNVERFVLISTDKCISPCGVMALSKRICEMMLTSGIMPPETQTHFIILRFGNVLGSSGSVIPVFGQQIADGGPVTVTHPEISRHFMTIPEACELILEAGFMGKSGEIYFFDMGEPVRISDMAGKMIRLSGLEPGKDIEIAYTGLRPGEKLEEEVICDKEHTMPTTNPKIRLIQRKNEYYPGILPRIDNILKKLYSFSKEEIIGIMKDMLKNNELTVDR